MSWGLKLIRLCFCFFLGGALFKKKNKSLKYETKHRALRGAHARDSPESSGFFSIMSPSLAMATVHPLIYSHNCHGGAFLEIGGREGM